MKPRQDQNHPFGGTGVGDQERVGISPIGKSEFPGSKETGHRKSRNPDTIGTVHLRGRVAGDWCHRRKARQEVVHRLIGNRDIGDPGHKGFVHFEIAIREIPMSGVQLSAQ